jgi:hypothetical protein
VGNRREERSVRRVCGRRSLSRRVLRLRVRGLSTMRSIIIYYFLEEWL